MRIVIIGGTGHIGTYLAPWLISDGHEVVVISRGGRAPYRRHSAWQRIESVVLDRQAAEADGSFGARVAALNPDAVVDLVCFNPESARQLVEALRGRVELLAVCGTIWVHGHSVEVPTVETQPRKPFGAYGVQKAALEAYLLQEAHGNGFPVTILHPGHIVGPGWAPLNPAGNFNLGVFEKLARGEPLCLPNLGLETVHHVHAEDVAQAFVLALYHRNWAIGESFHAVSPAALTLRGYAESIAEWYGRTAELTYLPWEEWRKTVSEEDGAKTWDHIAHSPNCSCAKAKTLLGYQPRYTSLQAVFEALEWLAGHGLIGIS